LKKKIEQAQELGGLERLIQNGTGSETSLASAKARYSVLEKLGVAKTALWKLGTQIDRAIVDLKSVEKVHKEKAALFEERERLTREISDLETQLNGLPALATDPSKP
jgi:cell division protein FtsB